ncbi:MAG: glycosyltransferase [Eubacterium sp.]|nr:glycosyltransferase [Eubacterium sp.]
MPNSIEKIADKRPSECRIIFISRILPKKTVKFALEIISNIKSNIIFDIYGPIEDEEYWSVCKELIEKMPENIDARYCGLLEHEEVMNTFRKYHLFFFPTFSENYGHVIVESLLSGCPVLTSDQVPWTDMQSYGCGFSFPLDARKDFINAVDVVSGWTQSEFNEAVSKCSEYTNDKIDFVKLKEKYCNMFNTATGSNATLGAK